MSLINPKSKRSEKKDSSPAKSHLGPNLPPKETIFNTDVNHQWQEPSTQQDNYFCVECGSFLFAEISDPTRCPVCDVQLNLDFQARTEYPTFTQKVHGPRRRAQDESKVLIQYECPECGNPEMLYWVMQTRGADEGASVFYQCANHACAHIIKENN